MCEQQKTDQGNKSAQAPCSLGFAMEPLQLCDMINGREYASEVTKEVEALAAENGLVIVFGASDDLMEIRGALKDEICCCNGGTTYFFDGDFLQNECPEGDDCPYFAKIIKNAKTVEALWCERGEWAWAYQTDIPHETFKIMDGGEKYCLGIVFKLSDI